MACFSARSRSFIKEKDQGVGLNFDFFNHYSPWSSSVCRVALSLFAIFVPYILRLFLIGLIYWSFNLGVHRYICGVGCLILCCCLTWVLMLVSCCNRLMLHHWFLVWIVVFISGIRLWWSCVHSPHSSWFQIDWALALHCATFTWFICVQGMML
jgi:hypothetical protein